MRATFARAGVTRWVPGALLLCALPACDGLDRMLEAEIPGSIAEEDLDDPSLAATLVNSVQGDFECAYAQYVMGTGMWSFELYNSHTLRQGQITALRLDDIASYPGFGSAPCTDIGTTPAYRPLHLARTQARRAIDYIERWGAAVPNPDFLLGKAYAYKGYSVQLLGEAWCELTFDGEGPVSREDAFRRAELNFTTALDYLGRVTGGPNADEARSLRNMSLVGRARARLNLGDGAGVLADAGAVEPGFVRDATYSASDVRRYNRVYDRGNLQRGLSMTEPWRNMAVNGVADPRVPGRDVGQGQGANGFTYYWEQLKYASRAAPIPLASWREAQLMIAEVQGGQAAVGIINTLRQTHGLPAFASTDAAAIRAQVLDERGRELYLQGTRLGDMLRNPDVLHFPTGLQVGSGELYGDNTCIPLHREELDAITQG